MFAFFSTKPKLPPEISIKPVELKLDLSKLETFAHIVKTDFSLNVESFDSTIFKPKPLKFDLSAQSPTVNHVEKKHSFDTAFLEMLKQQENPFKQSSSAMAADIISKRNAQYEESEILDKMKYEEKFDALVSVMNAKTLEDALAPMELKESDSSLKMLNAKAKSRLIEAVTTLVVKQDRSTHELLQCPDVSVVAEKIIALCGTNPNLSSSEIRNLQKIISIQLSLHDSLEEDLALPSITNGPLLKNTSTSLLERIFHDTVAGNVLFTTNERNEILVTIGSEEYNLTYLILSADLTQFRINEDDIELHHLSYEEQLSFYKYTLFDFVQINLLLRTGKIPAEILPFIDTLQSIFIDMCQISNALNKIKNPNDNVLARFFEEAKREYSEDKSAPLTLTRKMIPQIIDHAISHNIMTLAQANQWLEKHYVGAFRSTDFLMSGLDQAPGFTSAAKGKIIFDHRPHTMWMQHGINIRSISMYDDEAEVLIPSNQQSFFINNGTTIIVKPVNTPLLINKYNYSELTSLQFAFDHHLKFPFTETYLDSTDAKAGNVQRNNHGLLNTDRPRKYVDGIIEYFIKHISEAKSQKYLAQLDTNTISKIKEALAFAVTGRESEINWADNLEAVTRYKIAAAENFKVYAKNNANWNASEIERYAKLIRYMGIPHFLSNTELCNTLEDEILFYIFTLAHNLDLARCSTAKTWLSSIEVFSPTQNIIIKKTLEAEKDWIRLMKWAIQSIRATGDRLLCQFNENDELEDCFQDYNVAIFEAASLDPLTCHELLLQVPFPIYSNISHLASIAKGYVKDVIRAAKIDPSKADFYYLLLHLSLHTTATEFEHLLDRMASIFRPQNEAIVALLSINSVVNRQEFFLEFYVDKILLAELQTEILDYLIQFISEYIKKILPKHIAEIQTILTSIIAAENITPGWTRTHFPFIYTSHMTRNHRETKQETEGYFDILQIKEKLSKFLDPLHFKNENFSKDMLNNINFDTDNSKNSPDTKINNLYLFGDIHFNKMHSLFSKNINAINNDIFKTNSDKNNDLSYLVIHGDFLKKAKLTRTPMIETALCEEESKSLIPTNNINR